MLHKSFIKTQCHDKKGRTFTQILLEQSEITPILFYYKDELLAEDKPYAC